MLNSIFKIIIILFSISITACKTEDYTVKKNENIYNINYSILEINRLYEKNISSLYKNLMSDYSLTHYGIYTYKLNEPKIIVIHSTASYSIKPVIETFSPDILIGRKDARGGGSINLGAHFVVDRDGTIYSVIPINIIARHTIGFNHTAIGIENVGYPNDLTDKQLKANVALVLYLKKTISSIEYVIGHHEFNKKYMPHYHLARQYDNNYKLLNKIDPGDNFINNLRRELLK